MSESQKILTAIAQAKRAAIVLREDGDDDLPGAVGSFVLLYPDRKMTVCAEQFMRNAVSLYLASLQKAKATLEASADNARRHTASGLQRFFVSIFATVRNLFVPPRSCRSAFATHLHRLNAIAEWKSVVAVIA